MNAAVVRVGDTVRRAPSPQTRTVHRLLFHVRSCGAMWVPAPHGFDEHGREVLDFIPGEVPLGTPAFLETDHVLSEVAIALREWHDATATFARSPDDVWWEGPREPAEVICHGDFAPYNHVFRDGHFVGAIDFDVCKPAPRMWDLAYTAYRYIPLLPHLDADVNDGDEPDRTHWSPTEQSARLRTFLTAYGPLERPGETGQARPFTSTELLAWLPERLMAIAEWSAAQSSVDLQRHGFMYRSHAQWILDGGFLPNDDE
jgi:hypothetical protein